MRFSISAKWEQEAQMAEEGKGILLWVWSEEKQYVRERSLFWRFEWKKVTGMTGMTVFVCHDYNQMSTNYKDEQRFSKKTPTPIQTTAQTSTPTQTNHSSASIQQQPIKPPASTLTPIPQEYYPQDLTIHIDPSGHKHFVNHQGQPTLIRPFLNKYFLRLLIDPSLSSHQKQASIRSSKEANLSTYKLYTGSKIYNYDYREIHLLSQFYQSSFQAKDKQQIISTNSISRNFFLAYSLILMLTRTKKWATSTRKNIFMIPALMIPGSIWLHSQLYLGTFDVRAILEHHNAYQHILACYQNDNKMMQ